MQPIGQEENTSGPQRQDGQTLSAEANPGVPLVCPHCCKTLQGGMTELICTRCGRWWPAVNEIPHFVSDFPYWGEVPYPQMLDINGRAARGSWKLALLEHPDPVVRNAAGMILNLDRANWHWLVDLPSESYVLDPGAGTGINSHGLARYYRKVVALDPVLERVEFMRHRFTQENLANVGIVRSSLWEVPLAPATVDRSVLNGVLGWVAAGAPADPGRLSRLGALAPWPTSAFEILAEFTCDPGEKVVEAKVTVAEQQSSINQEMRVAVRHSIVYGSGTVLAKAISFLMLPLYTHYLSPRDYGILEILDLTMTLIGMFLNIGITSALLRYYNIHRSTSEKRKVVGTAFLFVIITGIAAWLLAALFAHPITRLLFSAAVPATYFLISFSSFTLGYITTVPNAYMQARESSGTLVLADAAMLFVILALNIYFVAIAQIGLVGILLSPLLGGSLRASVFAWRTIRHVGLAFSMARLRELVTFGAPLIFSNLALFTLNFSDRFFLQHFQSLQAVGIYAVGYKFGFLLNVVVIAPFAMMWQPRMYLIGRRPDREKIFSRIFVFYSLVLILGALALSLFGGAITQLMVDKRFASGKIVIPIIALAYVVYGVGYFLQAGLLLAVRTRTIGALSAVAALSNLGLNAVLIPQFGILGAAWATVLGFLVIAAGTCYFSWKSFATHLGVERVLKAFSVAVGLYILSLAISVSSPVAALLLKAMLLAMFPLLLGVTRSLSRDELASLHAGRHTVASFAVRILRPGQWRTGSV